MNHDWRDVLLKAASIVEQSERFLSDLLREAPPPRRRRRARFDPVTAVPVVLAVMFGVWAIVAQGRFWTGTAFLAVGAGIAWVFGRVDR